MSILTILKVKDNSDGGATVDLKFDKERLYSLIKRFYNKKRGSKQLVEKFIKDAVNYYVKRQR